MSGFPTKQVFTERLNASETLYVGGSLNQDVQEYNDVLPLAPSPLDKIYSPTPNNFNTFYGDEWVTSTPMPGQIFNLLTGPEAGLKMVDASGVPVDLSKATSFQVGGTAYVSISGDNATGALNDPSRQYLTIEAAYNDAILSLDRYVIYVFPGVYNVAQNICGPNISYVFSPGCTVNYTSTLFANGVGLDASGFKCTGSADFVGTAPLVSFLTGGGEPATDGVLIQCNSITVTTSNGIELQGANNVIFDIAADINVPDGYVMNTISDGVTYCYGEVNAFNIYSDGGFSWHPFDGELFINCESFYTTTNALVDCASPAKVYLESDYAQSFGVGYGVINTGGSGIVGIWVDWYEAGALINNDGQAAFKTCRIQTATPGLSNDYLLIDACEIGCTGSFLTLSGGSTFINAQWANVTGSLVTITAGYANINCNKLTSAGTAVVASGSSVILKGLVRANLPVSCLNPPPNVVVIGTIQALGLNSITSAVATNVLCYSSYANVIVDVNTTVVGDLSVNPAFIIY